MRKLALPTKLALGPRVHKCTNALLFIKREKRMTALARTSNLDNIVADRWD